MKEIIIVALLCVLLTLVLTAANGKDKAVGKDWKRTPDGLDYMKVCVDGMVYIKYDTNGKGHRLIGPTGFVCEPQDRS